MQRWVFLSVFLISQGVLAETEGTEDFDQILNQSLSAPEFQEPEKEEAFEDLPSSDLKDISDLGNLAPFDDVAVIQRRFLPRSSRFELFPALGVVMNDAFFQSILFNPRVGYAFTEALGVELNLAIYSTSERAVTTDLIEKRRVRTSAFISPQQYYGIDFKWDPVYGKLGVLNQDILPFDIYLSAGVGVTKTSQDTQPMTFHLGFGQIFALGKSMAARWDFSWYSYSSETKVTGTTEASTFTNFVGTLGATFFVPEASYR